MFGLIKKMFIGLLTGLVNGSNHTKYVSLSNQKYMFQPALVSLHPNEYSQEFYYYPFLVTLGRCVTSCNTLNDSSNLSKYVFQIKQDLNLSMLNMITRINESKTLSKHISSELNVNLKEENVFQING